MDEFKALIAKAIDAAMEGDSQALLAAKLMLSHLEAQLLHKGLSH